MLTRKDFLKFGLVIASPVWAPRSRGASGGVQLGPPSRVTSAPEKLFSPLIPYSDKGFILHWDFREKFEGPIPSVSLYRLDGSPVYEVKVMLPGSAQTTVRHLAANEDGTGMVCGDAVQQDGAVARFIGLLDGAGNLTRVIRTNPFQPFHACFGPDGTIWSLGANWDAHEQGLESEIFEHYSPDGELLERVVPLSSVPRASTSLPANINLMRACKDRIGTWLTHETHVWIELGTEDGRLLGMWRALPPATSPSEPLVVSGIAYTSDAAVYATFAGVYQGALLWWLDRSNSTWVPVPEFSMSREDAGLGRLLGRDGDQLVFQALNGNLHCYPLPPTPAGALPTDVVDEGGIKL